MIFRNDKKLEYLLYACIVIIIFLSMRNCNKSSSGSSLIPVTKIDTVTNTIRIHSIDTVETIIRKDGVVTVPVYIRDNQHGGKLFRIWQQIKSYSTTNNLYKE